MSFKPAFPLNLPGFNMVRVEESADDYSIIAEVSNPPGACVGCNSVRLIGHGRKKQVIRDIPTGGKRVVILVDTRRWRCADCGKTFMETLPGVSATREMTERLYGWIGQQSLKRTFSSIANDTGQDEKTIRNIFHDYVNELEAQFPFETPTRMGIGEIHLIRPRCVISNIHSNTIVNLLPNRDTKSLVGYLNSLQGKRDVQYVAMDMWEPYREAVHAVLPDARIVIDKFHLMRMANDAVEKVRRSLRERVTPKQRRGLISDRDVLLKRERELNDEERVLLEGWTKNYPELGIAYRLKESFCGIYEGSVSPDDAKRAYEAWKSTVGPEVRDAYHDLIRAYADWQPWILNYFEHPAHDTHADSLNRLAQVLDRLGRGYSFEAMRARILYTEDAHKVLAKPKLERRRRTEVATIAADASMGYGVPDQGIDEPSSMLVMAQGTIDAPHPTSVPASIGVDIDRLIELIESDKI